MPTEQVSARLQTHTISPQRSAFIEMALRVAIDPEQSFLLPPLPYRNLHCLCVNCMGLLWSFHCKDPINWSHPHEGDRCPYCNGSLLVHRMEKDWHPFYNSLYRELRHDPLKSCDKCRCWL